MLNECIKLVNYLIKMGHSPKMGKRRPNLYYQTGNHTKLVIYSPKYGSFNVYIDREDEKLIKQYHWCVMKTKDIYEKRENITFVDNFIAISSRTKTRNIFMHRLIMNCPQGLCVDHINHHTLDNRKENLRICTIAENSQNLLKAKNNNKSSKIRNVTYNKIKKMWCVNICLNAKNKYIGSYIDIKEAERAAIKARKEYMPFSQENLKRKTY